MQFSSRLIENAVEEFSKLPGVGKKTALRLVLHLLKQDPNQTTELAHALVDLRTNIKYCEKCFNIEDCLEISDQCGVPVVFDTHHYTCYNILHPQETFKPESNYLPAILETWRRRQIKPKFHVSEQAACCEGQKVKIGKHSDFIESLPGFLLTIKEPIDIMIEAKQKEQAIERLYDVHSDRLSRKRKIIE